MRSSSSPKEQNPFEAPVYDCPSCSNHTFILTDDNKFFKCNYCMEEENADLCSGPYGCASGFIPSNYLAIWDEEYGSKICEDCLNEYNSKINKF